MSILVRFGLIWLGLVEWEAVIGCLCDYVLKYCILKRTKKTHQNWIIIVLHTILTRDAQQCIVRTIQHIVVGEYSIKIYRWLNIL